MKNSKSKKITLLEKMLEDKKAIRKCVQSNGDLSKLSKDRGIKFATPVCSK